MNLAISYACMCDGDCGVFVIRYMEFMIFRKSLQYACTQEGITHYRTQLAMAFFQMQKWK